MADAAFQLRVRSRVHGGVRSADESEAKLKLIHVDVPEDEPDPRDEGRVLRGGNCCSFVSLQDFHRPAADSKNTELVIHRSDDFSWMLTQSASCSSLKLHASPETCNSATSRSASERQRPSQRSNRKDDL